MVADTAQSDDAGEGLRPTPDSSPGQAKGATELIVQLADMQDRWMRAEAEIANVRTRAKRDVEDAKRYAVQKFAIDVVEAAENLRRGLDSIKPPADGEPEVVGRLREGFLGVERAFIALLKRNGIVRLDPTGSVFDPALHQAMSQVAAAGRQPGTVLQALSAGWTLNGRLLRPAMVVVASAAEIAAPQASET